MILRDLLVLTFTMMAIVGSTSSLIGACEAYRTWRHFSTYAIPLTRVLAFYQFRRAMFQLGSFLLFAGAGVHALAVNSGLVGSAGFWIAGYISVAVLLLVISSLLDRVSLIDLKEGRIKEEKD